jgi:hypothetical protein
MAETFKNFDNTTNKDSFTSGQTGSRIQSKVSEVTDSARHAVENLQGTISENRPFMYAGIALLSVAAGFGIWALYRNFSGRSSDMTSQDYAGTESYRRSGAV